MLIEDMDIDLEPLPFEEAIAFFKDKVPMTDTEFYALVNTIRNKAFTVARVVSMDILMDIHKAIGKAIEDGETLNDFKNRLSEIMESRGWEGLTPWHTETVFRNNVQTSYSVGRYNQMMDQKEKFPYWEYDAVNDLATRPTHGALDGRVFPVDHPIWNTWYPPNGHGCRCGVNAVHRYEVDEIKVETEDPTGKLYEPKDPKTGHKMPARLMIPDKGWDYNPAKTDWSPDLTKYPESLKSQFEDERNRLNE